ncbi:unnamed protein product [Ceratitis capitata]|uniref:(Mediterranean fruit fly) hypothetical protein n=1 Tax=Ceratitis capitata TaxID=7213 RepID=A0A811VGX0_CERCA|nr:unnamed protein product [Ceratitis capitata]
MRSESLIKHYWDCAGTLDSEHHTHKLLKSYYMTICRKLAKTSVWMPKEKFSRNTMCRRCSSKWNETNFRMKLNPQEITYSAKAKRQIEKLYNAKSGIENRRALTRKQRKRAKWLKKRVMNSVEIQCELCQHKTRIEMHKPNKREPESGTMKCNADENDLPELITSTPVTAKTKKKKNKSKDKTAGLKIEKVQMVTSKNVTANIVDNKNRINNIKKQEHSVPIANTQQPHKKSIIKADVKTTTNLSQPLKAKKQKKKAKTFPTAAAPKIQSKTQQQNSILQLAALLKAQNKPGPNATQKD